MTARLNLCLVASFTAATAFLTSCATNDRVVWGGVPAWIEDGGSISAEPSPWVPDPAIIYWPEESGPIEGRIYDDRSYRPSRQIRRSTTIEIDETFARGRERRIRRLVR
ncbi:MAG: hypothetical protein AAF236_10750 [Verrucomicrobiota bacterium]